MNSQKADNDLNLALDAREEGTGTVSEPECRL